jgi:hypothetical protein
MKEYRVTIGGLEHTVLLSDEDAKQLGDAAKPVTKAAPAPSNKSRTPRTKES